MRQNVKNEPSLLVVYVLLCLSLF